MNDYDYFSFDDLDPIEFCAYYDLPLQKKECEHCGQLINIDVPFISGNLRGIKSGLCGCGKQKSPFVICKDISPPIEFHEPSFDEDRLMMFH